MTRKAIGKIKCPLCERAAEIHQFEERKKLNPDGPAPKSSYPAKLFIVCPPTTGYRGCGTILANAAHAQERLRELAELEGAPPKVSKPAPASSSAAGVPRSPPDPPPAPAPVAAKKFNLFDW